MDEGRREQRFPVQIQGRYRTGTGIARDVVVLDLSTQGCKLFDRFSNLRDGAAISLKVGSIGPILARVRWTEGSTLGIQFETALHASVLDHMVATIPDWNPAQEPDPEPEAKTPVEDSSSGEVIEVRIRLPREADVRAAIRELQLVLPLRSEAEVLMVFHAVLNRIFVEPASREE